MTKIGMYFEKEKIKAVKAAEKETAKKIAVRMLRLDIPVSKIRQSTGLTAKEIRSLIPEEEEG